MMVERLHAFSTQNDAVSPSKTAWTNRRTTVGQKRPTYLWTVRRTGTTGKRR